MGVLTRAPALGLMASYRGPSISVSLKPGRGSRRNETEC